MACGLGSYMGIGCPPSYGAIFQTFSHEPNVVGRSTIRKMYLRTCLALDDAPRHELALVFILMILVILIKIPPTGIVVIMSCLAAEALLALLKVVGRHFFAILQSIHDLPFGIRAC